MALTRPDFEGFESSAAQKYLNGTDAWTRKKGENYFRIGAVTSLTCEEPGHAYVAKVRGSYLYHVAIKFDGDWDLQCSCPVGYDCKHAYAAMKQLLREYAGGGGALAGGKNGNLSHPSTTQSELAEPVEEKLGRPLVSDEIRYLEKIHQLFLRATGGGLFYVHELTGLGVKTADYWGRLELYPSPPRSEAVFWNYLAFYLAEQAGMAIPKFLEPVTDLTKPRAAMQKLVRAREVERWNQMLANLAPASALDAHATAAPAELRVRFLRDRLVFEWRSMGAGNWTELKPRKADHFEAQHAASLSAAASLLWLAFWQRTQMQYASRFEWGDPWVGEQVGRWLRQPFLRPLLVDAAGLPLLFHEAPLRWDVAQPSNAAGDYSVSLVQADGQAAPDIWLAAPGAPPVYLTSAGVFTGPPFDNCVLSEKNTTRIPAPALETVHGLSLLQRLQAPPPPRLAARVRTVKLRPCVRAEIKSPWPEQEYCLVDVLGVSEDGAYIEQWDGNGWHASTRARTKTDSLIQIDRAGLGGLGQLPPQAGFKWDYNVQRWQLRVTKKFANVFAGFLRSLPADTRIDLAGELTSFQNAEVAGKIRLEASEAQLDWFDLRVIVDVNDTTLTKEEIKLLLDAKGGWVRLGKKGWRKLEFTLSEEEDRELARLGLTPHGLTSEPQRLHALQLADRAARKFLPGETCARIERRAAELQASVTPEVPAAIRASLRPYQLDGFHFLAYLSTNHFGGILADDMGLGKTLQTLAWLAWLRESSSATPAPSLVVCPKSVADNWRAEAEKFFPGLSVRVWSPNELKTFRAGLPTAELHVLNYSQLRFVADDVARTTFHAVILDEGQYIKNPSSQTAQVARQLRSEHRLILSGTPIENRLLDLWSLMSFAMPGALGSRAEFTRLFNAKDDPFARQRLSARVRPFLIRRTKAQVARDLPDRIEEDLYCELEGEQKTLYRAELKRAQAMLLQVKTAASLNKQRFNVLASLLRLRQICCHSKLVKPASAAASAKMEALFETLEPLIEEGQKVLVFSQFVELLGLLREEIKSRGWPHWYLAGDTEDRGTLVAKFQAAIGAGVFLISLKAGGFGLNLTAASYVVLFDPWWNPAVENQAIDRTHRIGQDRKVIAYRLLIKDSIEEKIRALQRQKKSLAEDVLGEEKFSQSLSLDDLRYLLAD